MHGRPAGEVEDASRSEEARLGPDHACEWFIDKGAPELGRIESEVLSKQAIVLCNVL